jgi:hypothetical protein
MFFTYFEFLFQFCFVQYFFLKKSLNKEWKEKKRRGRIDVKPHHIKVEESENMNLNDEL